MIRLVPLLFAVLVALPARGATLPEVYKRVYRSVVVIETEQTEVSQWPGASPVSVGGLGSGFVVSEDGLVMTAAHVVQTANDVLVHFADGGKVRARVVGSDPSADVALLQLERVPEGMPVAALGSLDDVEVGEEVFVVGAPLGVSYTLTAGHVSAVRQSKTLVGSTLPWDLVQTDAAINQGNSGGPLFDMDGEVIGIVSHIISQTGGSAGLGFAVSIDQARALLLDRNTIWSGFQGRPVEGRLAAALNIPQGRAILVERVAKGSPAERMGLQPGFFRATLAGEEVLLGGDVILGFEGLSVADEDFARRTKERLDRLRAGDDLELKVLRGGAVKFLRTTYAPPR